MIELENRLSNANKIYRESNSYDANFILALKKIWEIGVDYCEERLQEMEDISYG